MSITVAPFENGFGAEVIGVDFTQPIDSEELNFIKDAFSHHHVLSFRGNEDLTTDQVLDASRLFGKDLEAPRYRRKEDE